MKNKLLIIAILVIGCTTFISFETNNLYGQDPKGKSTMKDSVKYVCPHHPDIVSDKPGTCSKCGMDLVAKDKGKMNKTMKSKKDGSMHMKHDKMKKDTTSMEKKKM